MVLIISAPGFQARISFIHESDRQGRPGPAQHFDDRAGSGGIADANHCDAGEHIGFNPRNKFVGWYNLERHAFSVRSDNSVPAFHETGIDADVAPALLACDARYLDDTVSSAVKGPSA